MIISHEHKFIFIKTRKTAGSSVEKYLVNYLNWQTDLCTGSDYDHTPSIGGLGSQYNHINAEWIAINYPNEWKNYFKFSIVRNPWDTLVSFYYWYKNGRPRKVGRYDFDYFLKGKPLSYWNDWKRGMYTINENPVLDYICKYENLDKELKKIPVPYNGEMLSTFAKAGLRENKNYRDFYNDDSKQIVYNEFQDVIQNFNYKF